jgi:hypothetical protein
METARLGWKIVRTGLMLVIGGVSLAALGGGCGASSSHSKTGVPNPAGAATNPAGAATNPAGAPTNPAGAPTKQQITTDLKRKLLLHQDQFGTDVFDVPAGRCGLEDVITGSDATAYRPGNYTAISPDHSAVVVINVITSGGGAPASACLQAVKAALGWT